MTKLHSLHPALRVVVSIFLAIIACLGIFVVGWLAYAGTAWLGFGRLQVDQSRDLLLDRFMPVYEVAERHEILVNAPATATYDAACALDLQRSPVIRGIFRAREVVLRAPSGQATLPSRFVAQTLRLGWGALAEVPGRELVMGAVTQPWQSHVIFHALEPDKFAAFDSPGFVKIVWTLQSQPLSKATSLFRTITRVQTTDPEARRKFRRYWAIFSPGILLIRREALRLVRADSEQRYRIHGSAGVLSSCLPGESGIHSN